MPTLEVKEYLFVWKPMGGNGTGVVLFLENGWKEPIATDSAGLAALAAILNESPVWFRTEDHTVLTGKEKVQQDIELSLRRG